MESGLKKKYYTLGGQKLTNKIFIFEMSSEEDTRHDPLM